MHTQTHTQMHTHWHRHIHTHTPHAHARKHTHASTRTAHLQAAFQDFLSVFAIANVDVDLLGLACGEIDFETMWTIQAILLPLLYVAFVVADVALSWAMLQAAKARFGPVMFIIKKGWRPTRSFALSSISDRYLPHGLMYLNIYYLTGVSKALVLLQCESPEDGSKPYLAADPTLTCWEGTHAKMMGLNVISLLVYVVMVPLGYSYILFRRCPKEGLNSPRLYRVFGFLWSRFEDRCWWWEVGWRLKVAVLVWSRSLAAWPPWLVNVSPGLLFTPESRHQVTWLALGSYGHARPRVADYIADFTFSTPRRSRSLSASYPWSSSASLSQGQSTSAFSASCSSAR